MLLKVSKRGPGGRLPTCKPSLLDLTKGLRCDQAGPYPHVMGIQSQFKPLIDMWTSCIEDLKPLSRAMAGGRGPDL